MIINLFNLLTLCPEIEDKGDLSLWVEDSLAYGRIIFKVGFRVGDYTISYRHLCSSDYYTILLVGFNVR